MLAPPERRPSRRDDTADRGEHRRVAPVAALARTDVASACAARADGSLDGVLSRAVRERAMARGAVLARTKGLQPGTSVAVATVPGTHQIAEVVDDDYMVRIAGETQARPFVHWLVTPAEHDASSGSSVRSTPTTGQSKKDGTSSSSWRIVTDEEAAQLGLGKYNTPSDIEGEAKRSVAATTNVAYFAQEYGKSASIRVEHIADESGLTLLLTVYCNRGYMCQPHDLVRVTLERDMDQPLETIAAVMTNTTRNCATIEAKYTWQKLAGLLRLDDIKSKGNSELHTLLPTRCKELAVKAEWLAAKGGVTGNTANHFAGGVREKMGSGKVRLAAPTLDDYANTETIRNTDWNAQERLRKGRPVFDAYATILQEGKELATTLEAESEYVVDEHELVRVIGLLTTLWKNPQLQSKFGIVHMEGSDQPKRYVDTYFDLTRGGQPTYRLLKDMIVLRRRSVPPDASRGIEGDPAGTYLFAIKGRSVENEGEKIRLAAQANLTEGTLDDADKRATLREFMTNTQADNAFARVLADAASDETKTVLSSTDWDIAPSLTVVSHRVKFSMQLASSTAIDFSADFAEAEHEGRKATVCSFEFGVGHPGLTTASATSGGGSNGDSPNINIGAQTLRTMKEHKRQAQLAELNLIHRPYHVPADLDNPALWDKGDYAEYKRLRDRLITELFVTSKQTLTAGGNKATLLAEQLGLFSKAQRAPRLAPPTVGVRSRTTRQLPSMSLREAARLEQRLPEGTYVKSPLTEKLLATLFKSNHQGQYEFEY